MSLRSQFPAIRHARVIILVMIVGLSPAAVPVDAGTAFSQDPADHALSRISDWSNENQKADDFILTGGPQIIARIRWWGSYGADPEPAVDDFVFKFFVEDPGSPGFPDILCLDDGTRYPASYESAGFNRTATALVSDPSSTHDGGTVYAYSAVLDRPVALEGNKRYWLAITNSTPAYAYPPQPNSKWGWLESAGGSQWHRTGHCAACADDWAVSSTRNLAFALETSPKVGISNKAASDPVISGASTGFLFTVWGRARITGTSTFELDDGSGAPIDVESPGSAGFGDGDYVRATGLLSYSASGSTLRADATDVVKIR